MSVFTAPLRRQFVQLRRHAFTLIELLIVVAIIAILAAIAVPNFLEAQVRAKVSRVKSDLRTLAVGMEAYRTDHNRYAVGTDNVNKKDTEMNAFMGPLAAGYYTLQTRDGAAITAGRDFHTLTTPTAYVTEFFKDPFVAEAGGTKVTYCYRPATSNNAGWVLTSFGPDSDLRADVNGKLGAGTANMNILGTAADANTPARLGDINERAVIHFIENTDANVVTGVRALGGLQTALSDLTYDPTNGSISDGDIYRTGP